MSSSATFADVSGFLRPRSIAVVGATDAEGNLGGTTIRHLQKFGYPGTVFPVHPRSETVAGLRAYPSLADLPEIPDLVILSLRAALVPQALRQCAAAGALNIISWAGGFAEESEDGAALEREAVEICQEFGLRLLGPNCLGVIGTELPHTATFASFLHDVDSLLPGNISLIGQSGGIVTGSVGSAREAGFGIRYAISTGNEAILSAADFIAACAEDEETAVIGAYIEGTRQGEKLVAALALAQERGKPVVLLRGGASAAAARAAAAHTGSLTGEARVWEAVLQEFDVIQTRSQEEFLDVLKQISSSPRRIHAKSTGVAILSFGGGSGVLAADQATYRGLSIPSLHESTRKRLGDLVPALGLGRNPIDITPQVFMAPGWIELYPEVLNIIAADPGIDSVLLQYGPIAKDRFELAQATEDFIARCPLPVLLVWALQPPGISEWLLEHRLNCFDEFDRAIRVLSHFAQPSAVRSAPATRKSSAAFDWTGALGAVPAGTVISEYQCHALLSKAGLAVPAGRLVATPEEAADAGNEVGWPVVLKGMSEAVTHKFAAGLVRLEVNSPEAARTAAEQILDRARELNIVLDGVYVQHLVAGDSEILVSSFRDPNFGVMVSCGAGGVLTELIDDVAIHRAPFNEEVAERLLQQLRIVSRLTAKGQAVDLSVMAQFLSRFSEVSASAPWDRFVLEVNPVKWSAGTATAVDGLLIVEEP